MPRYEYRTFHPDAEKSFLGFIDHLDKEFANPDPAHRSVTVRDALHQIYLGRPYLPEDEMNLTTRPQLLPSSRRVHSPIPSIHAMPRLSPNTMETSIQRGMGRASR